MVTFLSAGEIKNMYHSNKPVMDKMISDSIAAQKDHIQLGKGQIWQLFKLKKGPHAGQYVMALNLDKSNLKSISWEIVSLGISDNMEDYKIMIREMKTLGTKEAMKRNQLRGN